MSKQPTVSNNACFNCVIVNDSLQCNDTELENQITIPIKDILCVLPSSGEHAYAYTMLFLQKRTDFPGVPFEIERIHLKSVPSALLSSQLLAEVPSHLCHLSNICLKLHIIISTASGTGTAKLLFSRILQKLLAWIGVNQYEVHETKSTQTITELCHSKFIPQAEAGVPQTIILFSGDGGLCDVINSFHGTPKCIRTAPNIGLIPAGTGNALASSTGLLAHPKASLTALLRGKPVPLPVFVATFSRRAGYVQDGQTRPPTTDESSPLRIYGGVVASWGLHAALVAESDTVEYREFGAERFKMAANELLFPSDGRETHEYNGTITLIKRDNQRSIEHEEVIEHKKHMYVLATLVSNLEKDFMISPNSAPLDGSLRFLHFGPMPSQRAMQLLSAAYRNGRHIHEDDVMYSEIEGFKVDFHEIDEKWRRVCIDGRVVMVEEEGWMKVHKERSRLVNILLPDF
ncbi:ATP-NAD kinase-like domain-containing protein [Aspergillus aurantiobrunneus]